jgi:hypothetical protein
MSSEDTVVFSMDETPLVPRIPGTRRLLGVGPPAHSYSQTLKELLAVHTLASFKLCQAPCDFLFDFLAAAILTTLIFVLRLIVHPLFSENRLSS